MEDKVGSIYVVFLNYSFCYSLFCSSNSCYLFLSSLSNSAYYRSLSSCSNILILFISSLLLLSISLPLFRTVSAMNYFNLCIFILCFCYSLLRLDVSSNSFLVTSLKVSSCYFKSSSSILSLSSSLSKFKFSWFIPYILVNKCAFFYS